MKPAKKADATCAFVDPAPTQSDANDIDLSFLSPRLAEGELGWLAHYRIYRVLGSGGMGIVFEAEDTHLHRTVALKVMRKELAANPTTRERFLQEARAAAALNSDYIVTVYQVGMANDVPYLSMQFLRGDSVQDRLERWGALPIAEALTITKQAAMGLADAHAIGLVHRDIKPANLWLESDGTSKVFKRVRILDFGLARREAESTRLTATGVVVGTPHFMAPEQASRKAVDGRADLFSLGGVLYSMLTAELAFDGDSVMAVLMALATQQPVKLSTRCPDIPVAVSELVDRMLEKNPDRRIQTAKEVVDAITAIQESNTDLNFIPALSGSRPVASANTDLVSNTNATHVRTGFHSKMEGGLLASTMKDLAAITVERKSWLGGATVGAGIVALVLGLLAFFMRGKPEKSQPPVAGGAPDAIVVGILHSQTGTMASSEMPVIDATMMAIDEINASGGLLNRTVRAVSVDGQSNPDVFKVQAERLIATEGVQAIFGCWTSASRKTIRPIIEQNDNVLFYPVQYEGLEQSPRIFYFGSTPNQQLIPGVDYLIDQLGKRRLFLVGSDYVFPRAAHAIIRDYVDKRNDFEVVGEALLPLGEKDVTRAIDEIRKTKPDAIVNTINGSTNLAFFNALRTPNSDLAQVSTMSVSISENLLKGMDATAMSSDYLVAAFFQSADTPPGNEFVRKLQIQFGDRAATDAMVSAYSAVHMWSEAVKASGSSTPSEVIKQLRGRSFESPLGLIRIDSENQHVWQPFWIGKVKPDGQLEIVARSQEPLNPEPWFRTRNPQAWDRFLLELFNHWDGRWQPAPKP